MCLILFGLEAHSAYPLVVVANRDEFRRRATRPLHRWPDRPATWGGRDAEAGGAWMGLGLDGRFAALTNVRDFSRPDPPEPPSRGGLVMAALEAGDPAALLRSLPRERYAGFNLLAGGWSPEGGAVLWVTSNAPGAGRVQRVAPGIHGLSNATLDVPWPKVAGGREALTALLAQARAGAERATIADAFGLLSDDTLAPDAALPSTGVPLAWERRLSARFITGEDYGTRSQTVLLVRRDGRVWLHERTITPQAAPVIRALQFDLVS